MDEPVLVLETAKKVYACIKSTPGLHMRELQRQLDMPMGTLQYQLDTLERDGIISTKMDGRYKRYYCVGKIGSSGRQILPALRKDVQRGIILYLLLNPKSKHKEILEQFDIAPSTLSFHLKKLTETGIIKQVGTNGDTVYAVINESEVAQTIIVHKKTFMDELIDDFVATWEEMHP